MYVLLLAAACGGNGGPNGNPDVSGESETSARTGASFPGASPEVVATLELEATYPEEFSFLNGVRELSDGTLLAADPLAEVLLRIDLDAGTADTLGRPGPGPQEYKQPDQVFALPGDSSLLVDLGKMQLTELGPDGVLGRGIPMAIQTEDRFPLVLHPRFVDRQGRFYDQAPRSRNGGSSDSVAIIRFDRATYGIDTVTMLWFPEIEQVRSRGGGFVPRMLEARNAWAVGADGRVAIAHAEDFSVEWLFPDGRTTTGPPTPFPTHRAGSADKEAILAGMRSSGISMTMAARPGGAVEQMTMSRGLPRGTEGPRIDDFEWAEELPPFRSDRVLISAQGEAWVERYLPVDSLPQVVVFDGDGRFKGIVTLPAQRQILGFGQSQDGHELAYLVRTDEYDLRWLERYKVVR
jgi:hypothetical protein